MSERINALAQHLLGKSSLEECNLEEIQHLTKRYPFFAPAQFLLLQKLKLAGSPDAVAQHRKATLYFHDPLQFQHFLSSESNQMDELFLGADPEPELERNVFTVTPENDDNTADLEEPFIESAEDGSDSEKEISIADTTAVFPEPDRVREDVAKLGPEPSFLPFHPLPAEPAVNKTETGGDETKPEPTAPAATDERTAIAEKTVDETKEARSVAPAGVKQPPAGNDSLFEPFHTVDYFASQGIKITADDLSKDKLAKQVRSFTEWLKIMKRLPAAEIAQKPQSSAEKKVENLASHSVEESEVLTETMAEVWAKQGAREKAIETYNKLSLLNPSKKAYFAAKIENLKGS